MPSPSVLGRWVSSPMLYGTSIFFFLKYPSLRGSPLCYVNTSQFSVCRWNNSAHSFQSMRMYWGEVCRSLQRDIQLDLCPQQDTEASLHDPVTWTNRSKCEGKTVFGTWRAAELRGERRSLRVLLLLWTRSPRALKPSLRFGSGQRNTLLLGPPPRHSPYQVFCTL